MFSVLIKSAVRFFPIFCLVGCITSPPLEEQTAKQQAAKARVEVGLGYLSVQNMQQAKINLDKALAHDPNYYLVHLARAYFYQQQGELDKAEQAYLTAIQLDPQQGDSYNNYGTFLCSQGQFAQAYRQFAQALAKPHYYNQADTYENLVLCNLANQDQAAMQKNLQQLRLIAPERAARLADLMASQSASGHTPK